MQITTSNLQQVQASPCISQSKESIKLSDKNKDGEKALIFISFFVQEFIQMSRNTVTAKSKIVNFKDLFNGVRVRLLIFCDTVELV